MSRWIDAEWIRNVYADFEHYENRDDWTTPISNVLAVIDDAPRIDICFCRECIYYDPPHVEDNGKRIEYKDLPEEAFDELGTGLVNVSYGVNIGGRCCVDYNYGYAEDKRVYRAEDNFCSRGERKVSEKPTGSEKPNNSKERSNE